MPSRNDTIEPQTSRYRYVTRFKGARDAVDIAALVKIPFSSESFRNFLRDRAVSLSVERLLARVRAEIRRDGIRQAKRTTAARLAPTAALRLKRRTTARHSILR